MNTRVLLKLACLLGVLQMLSGATANAAGIIVAAANSSPQAKARADFICSGTNDQVLLLKSINEAPTVTALVDASPSRQTRVTCLGRHSVEWMPGDYYLGDTLVIPDAADMVIQAEGTRFHYTHAHGDAVRICGMMRCRYHFGYINSESDGAALQVKPTQRMQAIMSCVSFTGLAGTNQTGVGLFIDPNEQGVCVNRFEGTDISGFNVGVFVDDAEVKCDTDFFWFNYVRMCNTCIWERGQKGKVDDNVWDVNVDASLPHSVAIRTSALYGRWHIIMGTYAGKDNGAKALILDLGAKNNIFDMHPPIGQFEWMDNSGNTNIIR